MFHTLSEQRIQDALQRGDLDDLPGSGRPLELGDELLVPEEVRAVYRVLKNAGFVPPEVLELREVAELEKRIPQLRSDSERARALQKLALLRVRLGERRSRVLSRQREYEEKILHRLGGD